MPVTDWKDRYATAAWMVRINPDAQNGLTKASAADAFQVRCLAQERFVQRIGKVSDDHLSAITDALAVVLKIRS